jgi:membrane protease YdiL (CAAX protease family)
VLDGTIAFRLFGTTVKQAQAADLTWGIVAGQYAAYLPLLAALVWVLPWLSRRSLRELGLRALDGRTIGAALLGALAMYAVTIGVANVQFALTHQKPQETAIALFTSTHDPGLLFAFTILAAVAAPFIEEFVYRGFLFNALLRYMPMWVAAVLSGLLFGISHGRSAFLPLAGSGIVLAYVYYRTGSLTASMLTHATFNLVNVALLSVVKS